MSKNESYRQIPSVNQVLECDSVKELVGELGQPAVTCLARQAIEAARQCVAAGGGVSLEEIAEEVSRVAASLVQPSLKGVINATGVLIHTNLGRAPLGEAVMESIRQVATGYCNLEYDLTDQSRGRRGDHVRGLLTSLTGAQDALVVNNNAAGLILALNTLAGGKEVIVSRGELVEIGGSFRVPDILAASGAKMVEVGTTNKTHLHDYENAINENTAMLLKVHRSNYDIVGFSEEVDLKTLSGLARRKGLVSLYDIGSGLLRRRQEGYLAGEPDVFGALQDGVHMVAFSGDKLLGGPQCGVLVGEREFISRCARAPMHRALRVGKLTLAALYPVLKACCTSEDLSNVVPLFVFLNQTPEALERKANTLCGLLETCGVKAQVVKSEACTGGGTMPQLTIPSFGVKVVIAEDSKKQRKAVAQQVFESLHGLERPVVGVLRQGELVLDVTAVDESEFKSLADGVAHVLGALS